jgi:F0F1-type ATP synthase assembly protein I
MDLGLRFAAAATLFGLFGHWVDGKLHTTPMGLIVGVMLGGVGGFIYIYRTVMRLTEEEKKKAKQ